jgi:hypothetical protein
MTTQRFQTIIARARAHRVAVLVDINDPYWEASCVGVVQYLTKLWGGSLTVIVPTDGKTISEEFWAVLSAHDPDKILCYRTTGKDVKIAEPEKFKSYVDQWTAGNLQSTGMTEEELRPQMEEHVSNSNTADFSISEELSLEIVRRLAPLHIDSAYTQDRTRQLDIGYISRGASPSYPLTSVLDVVPFADCHKTVSQVICDAQDTPSELWIAASIGSNDPKQIASLAKVGIFSKEFRNSQLSPYELITLGLHPGDTLRTPTPRALSMTALAYYRSSKALRHQLPTVVVVGDTVSDFCLFYALRWLQGRALWLPKWFFRDSGGYNSRVTTAIRGAAEIAEFEHSQNLSLVTFSLSNEEMKEAEAKAGSARFGGWSVECKPLDVPLIQLQLQFPTRSCTAGSIGDISTRMFVEGELPGVFETPRPLKINPLNAQQHRWMVDVSFEDYLLPRHPAVASYVVAEGNLLHARSGKDAVSYACPGVFVMGDDMDTNLVRPRLRMPTCEKVFEIIFRDCGYETQVSDKGAYASQVCDKFGGLDQVGFSLRSSEGTLLRKYLDTTEPPKGNHEDGTYLNDKRRYLNFAAIAKILGSPEDAIRVIDSFVSRGVFYRGFIFQCRRCSDVAWFSISDISETFACRRCRTTQPYTKKSWRHPNEPAWFYKLDEIVYLTLLHNGDISLLTLDLLRRRSKESFLYCPELCIRPEGTKKAFIEVDICCVMDGRLCIGEAKSVDSVATNQFKPQQIAERYRDLALKMGATLVVFSTSQTVWSKTTFEALSQAFHTYPYIEVLTIGEGGLYQN